MSSIICPECQANFDPDDNYSESQDVWVCPKCDSVLQEIDP